MENKIQFLGALAGTNNAAKWLMVNADGDAKLTLETPASELDAVIELRKFSGKAMRITIEALDE